jgi:hypothetical protein
MHDSQTTLARYVDRMVRCRTKGTRLEESKAVSRGLPSRTERVARRTHADDAPKITRCFDRKRGEE